MPYDLSKINYLIETSGVSKKVFFSQIGMSEKTFLGWLTGKSVPKESSILKIANKLGTDISALRPSVNEAISLMEKEPEGCSTAKRAKRTLSDEAKVGSAKSQINLKFQEDELAELRNYDRVIIFDTCSIMNYPDLLDYVQDNELVVIPKVVNDELEHLKTRHFYNEPSTNIKVRRAIDKIFDYKRKYPLFFAETICELIPESYRAESGEQEASDNKILSVAIRYRKYSGISVIFITEDKSLSNKAYGEKLDVRTADEFISLERSSSAEEIESESRTEISAIVDYAGALRVAIAEMNVDHIILCSIILKKLSVVQKYICEEMDESIKGLGELYISLRSKKNIPKGKMLCFQELIGKVSSAHSEKELYALSISFCAAYRDALSSLCGAIKQIAGDL